MLQSTQQLEPSLRHRLASRLATSMQNMHTPLPTPDPHSDTMLGLSSSEGFDPAWAIFDQNSINFVSQGLQPERPLEPANMGIGNMQASRVGSGAVGGTGGGNDRVRNGVGQNYSQGLAHGQGGFDSRAVATGNEFGIDGQWMGHEPYSDAWQSTLFRLFGNTEMPMTNNGLV